jgi:hypothetical protein
MKQRNHQARYQKTHSLYGSQDSTEFVRSLVGRAPRFQARDCLEGHGRNQGKAQWGVSFCDTLESGKMRPLEAGVRVYKMALAEHLTQLTAAHHFWVMLE